ncbi:MAG: Glutamate--tRNA ligase [Candidatus Methanofastidiosum methylothiophilum]|uniref:Glutamate--tRNA ligase n=1 Tax=Candidatus Methanofastidiosum methylothiophilum TaxID=1705564 RepID=A0A150J0L9_9EURY|nr:MAG: Glutamate--tRNA ligase [Candidatus Methanofastidiosum methylthiophilus]KYC48363.1 MAG: Glutamate--tRNA ligase [Candidatus Methanofastidiosum methylthiophilus]KYC50772.1 MAG: Glutamate--tRNA ligase [Candidatus Methanofastidiosum methylthiophilus]
MSDDLIKLAHKYTLINAFQYGGTPNAKAVTGKIMAELPEMRKQAKEVISAVEDAINQISKMSHKDIENKLREINPEYFSEKPKEKEAPKELPPLEGAEMGKVVTRLPPEPNGYPHIGHGMSFYFNYYYAKKYGGKVILRFDDTNPKKEKLEYYDAIKQDLKWLKISWDEERNMSDDMDLYYKYALDLINMGKAYVCNCDPEYVSKLRYDSKDCPCASNAVNDNLSLWKEMQTAEEGKYSLRLRGDMSSKNTVMRDPTMMRVVDHPHPIQGDKYRIWPVYDFACAIEDSVLGVTHVLRSNEFTLRIELQDYIRGLLKLRNPKIIEYSRFTVKGAPTSKRLIRPLIEEHVVSGWDDPRLVTIRGLKRRGITPEAIHMVAEEIGLSKSEPEIDWSLIESLNRKVIDSTSDRYYFVSDPKSLEVIDASYQTVQLKRHPDFDRGFRTVNITDKFYISGNDFKEITKGQILRLKDLYNIFVIDVQPNSIKAMHTDENSSKDELSKVKKIHWVSNNNVKVNVVVPGILYEGEDINPNSLTTINGYGEEGISSLKEGDIVQFERFGFVRVDKVDSKEVTVILAHK